MAVRVVAVAAMLILVVLGLAARKPDRLRIQRSIRIAAPPQKVFALIDDFHQWPKWAPQDRDDSSMTRTFSGAPSGLGAVSDWTSTGSAGRGRMTIVESEAGQRVVVGVDFVKPFQVHNVNQFLLEPVGGGTEVTWTMNGSNLFVMKVMGVFVSMDKMAGKHFEKGLEGLRRAAEGE